MRAARTRFATAMLALAVMASPAALAQMPPPTETTPVPKISLPPVEATATPLPGTLLKTQGQLLDIQDGFVFFTSGDGFKLAPDAKIVTLETGAPVAPATIPVRAFAAATFNSQTGQVVQLAISKTKLKTDQTYVDFENVRRYAIVTSTPAPNPELAPKKGVTGKLVAVTFIVRVPATTGLNDLVYITTDQSGWNPQAIRLDRIDGLHYRITSMIPSGTDYQYKYTRGTWTTQEIGENGIQGPPRHFRVAEATRIAADVVYYWADQNAANPAGGPPAGPDGIPTPFNPVPFGFPTPPPRK